ncbi:molybdenum cofactor sulfurase isoform X2 [Polyodon spathula]|uniref:molybdenum cofactor sulfurase isoform X2 n=1 Tax=Polyodon spathula TaxID=7913 RepID=UPI001B7EC070|nr:molybdenum cofactor sulfurase isoform X2 [Polyodon spathula]
MDIKEASSLEELCTFEGFKKVWKHYGYDSDLQKMKGEEFCRIKGITYLDHAGTTLFSQSQIEGFSRDLAENVYGNPHSHNLSSRLTHDTVEHVRFRILQHFNVSPEEYTVIFTSGCTAAIKIVAESFPWRPATLEEPGSCFCYLTDSHTSIVGIRGVTSQFGVTTIAVKPNELSVSTQSTESNSGLSFEETPHLFSYPAQSNFSGTKYPLRWIHQIQTQKLYPSRGIPGRWFVLLDAACFVGCSPLDLQAYPADFVPISFYKIFGFPTGLGALLVRNDSSSMMRKNYFGGGTAAAYLVGEHFFVPKMSISSRFEDGTIPFLDIIALNHGFNALERLTKGMKNIRLHTFGLARYTYLILSTLQHANGKPVARIYSDTEFCDPSTQGAIINFNVLDSNGDIIGYSQVKDWPIGAKGLLYDRTWMVVNLNSVCLSQKQEPRLCLIQPQIDLERNTLAIRAKGMSTVTIPVESRGEEQQTQPLCQSKVCGDRVKTFDCGDEVADWISKFLGRHCRLIRQGSDFTREVKKGHLQGQAWVSASLSLVNEAQYLMVNRTSILHLQEEIQKRNNASTLQFNTEQLIGRFRANFVVCGTQPFEEDGWTELKIGHTSFQVVGQCGRCQMIGIDQDTGTRSKEPLQTLSACRRGKVTFGVYLLHQPSETSSYPITISAGSWISAVVKREGCDPAKENHSGKPNMLSGCVVA